MRVAHFKFIGESVDGEMYISNLYIYKIKMGKGWGENKIAKKN
jgi:hypothetical protein